jgi:hypothetical protein
MSFFINRCKIGSFCKFKYEEFAKSELNLKRFVDLWCKVVFVCVWSGS